MTFFVRVSGHVGLEVGEPERALVPLVPAADLNTHAGGPVPSPGAELVRAPTQAHGGSGDLDPVPWRWACGVKCLRLLVLGVLRLVSCIMSTSTGRDGGTERGRGGPGPGPAHPQIASTGRNYRPPRNLWKKLGTCPKIVQIIVYFPLDKRTS